MTNRACESYDGVSALATSPNEAFFWSSRTAGVGGADNPAKIAESQGGTTLESLMKSKGLRLPEWDLKNPISVKAWREASEAYAKGAKGKVRVVLGQNLRPDNVWEGFELPALKANPAVTSIESVDPATGATATIFSR